MEASKERVRLGVDMGATKIRVGAITQDGRALKSARFETLRDSQEETIQSLKDAIDRFLQEWEGARPEAIGVGLVGHVSPANGMWLHSLNAKIYENVPIASILQEQFQLPVSIDNDVNCATLAELYYGVGKVSDYFLVINVGTGIGCGIVDGGRLIRGVSNSAGEAGHMCVESGGDLCKCGFFGCLENIVGGAAIERSVRAMLPSYPQSMLKELEKKKQIHIDKIVDAARRDDPLANKIVRRCIQALGISIVNLANLLNPEYIVLAGSVMSEPWLTNQVRKFVYDNALIETLNYLRGFGTSQMNASNVGMYGAACLCCQAK